MIEQFQVLSAMNGKPQVTVSELSNRWGEPFDRMKSQMRQLKLKGYISEIGANPEDPAYTLTPEGQAMVGAPINPTLGEQSS